MDSRLLDFGAGGVFWLVTEPHECGFTTWGIHDADDEPPHRPGVLLATGEADCRFDAVDAARSFATAYAQGE